MMNIALSGHGRMGRIVEDIINESDDFSLAGVCSEDYSDTFGEIEGKPDVIIDYSHPD